MFALDKEALQQLHAAGAQAFYIADVQLHASSQGDQGSTPLADVPSRSSSFGSDDFKAIVRKKPLLLMRVLQVCVCARLCVFVSFCSFVRFYVCVCALVRVLVFSYYRCC